MPSLDSIQLVPAGFRPVSRTDESASWENDHADDLTLNYIELVPDIPFPLESVAPLRKFYRKLVGQAGGAMVALDVVEIAGIKSMQTLFKFPLAETGCAYLGALTLPFKDFSYVIKVQCKDRETARERDAAVLNELLRSGEIKIDDEGGVPGWSRDPYDPDYSAEVLPNLSDDERWDERFPDHPLSRARRLLASLPPSIDLSMELLRAPRFQAKIVN